MNRPNILYIHSHDSGRYLQPYGHAVPTPAIQYLADQGLMFRRAFCAAPTCSPSRAALLTGQWAHCTGMLGLAHRGFSLNDPGRHLAHTLSGAGYHTVLAGIQHVADDSTSIGYVQDLNPGSYNAADVAAAAAAFVRGASQFPFFLDVGFFETHLQYPKPGPDENEDQCLPPVPLPDTSAVRRDMAGFKASARLLDDGIGLVLQALERSGLANDTLVICTTDHGIALPRMKCNLTDHGMGVMLIMRGPGGFEGGRIIDSMVSHIDLYPTLCEFLEIAPPAWLQGRSLMSVVMGDVAEINEAVFAEVTYHAAYEPQRAVRTQRWKYIRRYQDRQSPVLPNCDDSNSKTFLLENGWRERPLETEELYDLVFDPNETCNLVREIGVRDVTNEMRNRLDEWMFVTHDPLLDGPVPAPSGAVVSDEDALSPRDAPTIIE